MNRANRQLLGAEVSEHHRRHVGDHHPHGRAQHHAHQRVIACRERHGRNLGLVAHFHQEKRNQRGTEHAEAPRARRVLLKLVGNQGPDGHGDERQAEYPSQGLGTDQMRKPSARRSSDRVVGKRRDQNACNNRQRAPESRRKQQRQQLRLIADFRERDDAGRHQKRIQLCAAAWSCQRPPQDLKLNS
ncbi:MAG: hypothetical protein A3H32_19085 [Betaproteobacteria bacterium RIFCSPLOWO2_02_FULL_63_19]|nr:MAG: hypothetical protein A3H32_19085 [Betaproteobacteria bacterium RIFCSPLOWO2_02_FULL_63_19]